MFVIDALSCSIPSVTGEATNLQSSVRVLSSQTKEPLQTFCEEK